MNKKYLACFEYDKIYHVYNKANEKELLFRGDNNYYYFLALFSKYLSPLVDLYAWSLLPNHFHLLVKVKPREEIRKNILTIDGQKITKTERMYLNVENVDLLLEKAFTRLFIAYSMGFNRESERRGNLFYRTFRRVEIQKDGHFTQALIYIHANGQKHKLVKSFTKYKCSSYHTILSKAPTKLLRQEVIDWFRGIDRFIEIQRSNSAFYYSFDGSIEGD